MATPLDLITAALKEIGVLAAGETPTAEDSADALAALNRRLDTWSAERLKIISVTRTVFTIVSGTQTYTVGTGGTVNVARPVFIDAVYFQDTSLSFTTEYPLQPLTDEAYEGLTIKTLTAVYPTAWYYNPTFPLGTLTLWPKPTGSSTLQGVLYAPLAVAQFASLATTISLAPGYQEMLVKNLALILAPSYERTPSQLLVQQAEESKAIVKRANHRLTDLSFEEGAIISGASTWNIRVGP